MIRATKRAVTRNAGRHATMTYEAFLPRAPLGARLAPWSHAAAAMILAAATLMGAAAFAARLAPASADERGAIDLIELASIEMTTLAEDQEEAAAAQQQLEQSTKQIDERKSLTRPDDPPQEQASPTSPPEEDLRLAQEKTRETSETETAEKQTSEAQEARETAAPAPSQASLASERSQAVVGEARDETAAAPDVGAAREGEKRLDAWRKQLFAHIGRHRFYPDAARRKGLKGETLVAFALDAQGRIARLRVERSSGSTLLDEAALEVLRRADPAPAPPADLRTPTELALPLRFALK